MVLLASAAGLFLVAVALVVLAVVLILLAPRLGRQGAARRGQTTEAPSEPSEQQTLRR